MANNSDWGSGECPDFFAIPRDCDGCGNPAGLPRPTHVRSNVQYILGTYLDGPANTTGSWTALSPAPDPASSTRPKPPAPGSKLDGSSPGYFYAAKSFVRNRRGAVPWSFQPALPKPSRSGVARVGSLGLRDFVARSLRSMTRCWTGASCSGGSD